MVTTKVIGWGRGLLRATLIGTVLQLALTVTGHYDPRVAKLFAVMGMFLSLVAGFLAGRWSAGLGKRGSAASGMAAGALCAFLAILESFYFGDVPAWVIAFGPFSSGVTGAIGGFLGGLTRRIVPGS
jgi:hypothetical protein